MSIPDFVAFRLRKMRQDAREEVAREFNRQIASGNGGIGPFQMYAQLERVAVPSLEVEGDTAILSYAVYQPETESADQIIDRAIAGVVNAIRALLGNEWARPRRSCCPVPSRSMRSPIGAISYYSGDATLSVSQVAWLLGFQEVSAFTHGFKRWTGQTPTQQRSSRLTLVQ